MKFRAHESFFIRKGWLYKGLKNIAEKDDVFTSKDKNPMDTLGLGSNMVKSLRYWLQAVGLTTENKSGKRVQTKTALGELIWNNDRYVEELGTLWLLHYELVKCREVLATSWYYFFNEFRFNEFSKNDFITSLGSWAKMHGEEPAESSIEGDFDCLIKTYLSRAKIDPNKVSPEDNIDCPFGELELIEIVNKKDGIYKKVVPKKDTLHPLIVLSVILDNKADDKAEIRINNLQNDKNNVGKIFNLDSVLLNDYLHDLSRMGYIDVVRTAGLDVIKIKTNMDYLACVLKYYQEIGVLVSA